VKLAGEHVLDFLILLDWMIVASAVGAKQTFQSRVRTSEFDPKADIAGIEIPQRGSDCRY
jgi:hypothetical protein